MSNQVEDERRFHQCLKKYDKIVNQFDELIEMMNTKSRLPKRRGGSSGSKGSSSTAAPSSSSQPADNNEVFVQTITRFLHEIKTNPTDP
ncbi:hypothetical protein CJ030_MR2G009182 [Morella rubra]|uniref:Uncharacterized protein n=1 Tax=Morella rubra TaxID=262757 RepID=A0A6A1WEV4_9ROSI|nr:hypothetical protein CJ030_MR2G009182 [Morella rubra]